VKLLELVARPYCRRCGTSLAPAVPVYEDGCSRCPVPVPRFERVVRLGPYCPPLRNIITDMKYRGRTRMAGRIAAMLSASLEAGDDRPDLIVPIPMHFARRIWRRVDHTAVISRALARASGIPVSGELLRLRNTPQQAELTRSRRAENVRGAFRARSRRALAGAHVLLVDDVTTTTATADEAAGTLLATGAASVTLAILARTEPRTG
jgi:ComF family protein